MKQNPYLPWLEKVAIALGDLRDRFAFVGGAVVPLYLNDVTTSTIRKTQDIDCVIEVTSEQAFRDVERELRERGFKHDMNTRVICRFLLDELIVDIMPMESTIFGFSNKWYKEGFRNKQKYKLPNGLDIIIFSLPVFMATKFEAFLGRKEKDYRFSHDIEDIITLLDANTNILSELNHGPENVRASLKKYFLKMKESDEFNEAISCQLGYDEIANQRSVYIIEVIDKYLASEG
ncbi:MAG: hypothetical protein ABII18_00795 [bacterium]|nr:hypothetical protein [bacterium]MBU1917969.1 hypothetical protein [bacterium]